MAGFLNMSSVMMCPHGGKISATTTNTRTKAGGDYMLRSSDVFVITGCSFVIGTVPHPCVRVQWDVPSEMTQVTSDFALTEESVGMCLGPDGAPQGTVLINFTQSQASGS